MFLTYATRTSALTEIRDIFDLLFHKFSLTTTTLVFIQKDAVWHLWHVHVVDEVDEIFRPGRAVVSSGLLLERFLHHMLKYLGCCVEVERDVGDYVVVIGQTAHSVVDQHRLTGPSSSYQHHGPLPQQQQVEEISNSCCLCRVNQRRLPHSTSSNIINTVDMQLTIQIQTLVFMGRIVYEGTNSPPCELSVNRLQLTKNPEYDTRIY